MKQFISQCMPIIIAKIDELSGHPDFQRFSVEGQHHVNFGRILLLKVGMTSVPHGGQAIDSTALKLIQKDEDDFIHQCVSPTCTCNETKRKEQAIA